MIILKKEISSERTRGVKEIDQIVQPLYIPIKHIDKPFQT